MDCGDVNGNKYLNCCMYGFHLPYKVCTDACYYDLKFDKKHMKKRKKEIKEEREGKC